MNYMGSKASISSSIVPIIQKCIMFSGYDHYIEPFVGGANIIEHIKCNTRVGADINRYLISLLRYAQLHEISDFPEDVTYEEYCSVRDAFNIKSAKYEDWYVGCVGFLASFNGRFFDGGFAKPHYSDGQHREPYKEHLRNLMKQNLSGIDFIRCDYKSFSNVSNHVVYCDPPYANTKDYNGNKDFDSDEFWEFARKLSDSNIVLISEQIAPKDFTEIWSQDVKRQINTSDDKFMVSEKLYVYEKSFDVINEYVNKFKTKRLF